MEQISLHSGNGTVGGPDSAIRALVLASAAALSPAKFTSAQSAPPAEIIVNHPAWKPNLGTDPSAAWIGDSQNARINGANRVLYAMDFSMTVPTIAAASLDSTFLVDNVLGNAANEGLYINGIPVSGSRLLPFGTSPSYYQIDQTQPTRDITSLVAPGINTLYFY